MTITNGFGTNGNGRHATATRQSRKVIPCSHWEVTVPDWPGVAGPVTIAIVPISWVKAYEHNPKSRSNPRGANITRLRESLTAIGQLGMFPVSPDGTQIDGHCTNLAAGLEGWDRVAVMVTDTDPAEAFRHINRARKNHSANQQLELYLADPGRVDPRPLSLIRNMEEWFEAVRRGHGRRVLTAVCKEGGDHHTYWAARHVAEACGLETPAWVERCVLWMLRWKQREKAKGVKNGTVGVKELVEAVEHNRPLCTNK